MVGPYGLNLVRVGVSLILFWVLWLMGKSIKADKVAGAGLKKNISGDSFFVD
jgi:hypothetical protein